MSHILATGPVECDPEDLGGIGKDTNLVEKIRIKKEGEKEEGNEERSSSSTKPKDSPGTSTGSTRQKAVHPSMSDEWPRLSSEEKGDYHDRWVEGQVNTWEEYRTATQKTARSEEKVHTGTQERVSEKGMNRDGFTVKGPGDFSMEYDRACLSTKSQGCRR
jgi:hypothetical protein